MRLCVCQGVGRDSWFQGKTGQMGMRHCSVCKEKQGCIFLVYKRDGFVNALERLESVFVLRDLCVCVCVCMCIQTGLCVLMERYVCVCESSNGISK